MDRFKQPALWGSPPGGRRQAVVLFRPWTRRDHGRGGGRPPGEHFYVVPPARARMAGHLHRAHPGVLRRVQEARPARVAVCLLLEGRGSHGLQAQPR